MADTYTHTCQLAGSWQCAEIHTRQITWIFDGFRMDTFEKHIFRVLPFRTFIHLFIEIPFGTGDESGWCLRQERRWQRCRKDRRHESENWMKMFETIKCTTAFPLPPSSLQQKLHHNGSSAVVSNVAIIVVIHRTK